MEHKPMNGQGHDLHTKSHPVVHALRNTFLTLLSWSLGLMVVWFWASFFLTFGMRAENG